MDNDELAARLALTGNSVLKVELVAVEADCPDFAAINELLVQAGLVTADPEQVEVYRAPLHDFEMVLINRFNGQSLVLHGKRGHYEWRYTEIALTETKT